MISKARFTAQWAEPGAQAGSRAAGPPAALQAPVALPRANTGSYEHPAAKQLSQSTPCMQDGAGGYADLWHKGAEGSRRGTPPSPAPP